LVLGAAIFWPGIPGIVVWALATAENDNASRNGVNLFRVSFRSLCSDKMLARREAEV
jgi:hypothetical protein